MSDVSTDVVRAVPDDTETHGSSVESLSNRLKGLSGKATTVVSTLPSNSFEERVANMEIVTNSTPLVDQGTATIMLRNVVVQMIEMDGNAVPRVILVDEDGNGYHAISAPILGSIETLFGVVGHPSTWPSAIPTTLEKVRAERGYAFTLRFGS